MQIQPQNNVNFTAKYPFNNAWQKTRIISNLSGAIDYRVVDSCVITGKDLSAYVKASASQIKDSLDLEKFSNAVAKRVEEFKAAKRL